jgi:hypothetical protein
MGVWLFRLGARHEPFISQHSPSIHSDLARPIVAGLPDVQTKTKTRQEQWCSPYQDLINTACVGENCEEIRWQPTIHISYLRPPARPEASSCCTVPWERRGRFFCATR